MRGSRSSAHVSRHSQTLHVVYCLPCCSRRVRCEDSLPRNSLHIWRSTNKSGDPKQTAKTNVSELNNISFYGMRIPCRWAQQTQQSLTFWGCHHKDEFFEMDSKGFVQPSAFRHTATASETSAPRSPARTTQQSCEDLIRNCAQRLGRYPSCAQCENYVSHPVPGSLVYCNTQRP